MNNYLAFSESSANQWKFVEYRRILHINRSTDALEGHLTDLAAASVSRSVFFLFGHGYIVDWLSPSYFIACNHISSHIIILDNYVICNVYISVIYLDSDSQIKQKGMVPLNSVLGGQSVVPKCGSYFRDDHPTNPSNGHTWWMNKIHVTVFLDMLLGTMENRQFIRQFPIFCH